MTKERWNAPQIISPNYNDRHAADELRKEMRRYSKDRLSCFTSICDFCAWLFACHMESPTAAKIVEREKQDATNAYADPILRESDQKSLLQWLVWQMFERGWPGVAVIIDNYAVEQYGELDEESYSTKEEKEEARKRIAERMKLERQKSDELNKWLETPSTIVSKKNGND